MHQLKKNIFKMQNTFTTCIYPILEKLHRLEGFHEEISFKKL